MCLCGRFIALAAGAIAAGAIDDERGRERYNASILIIKRNRVVGVEPEVPGTRRIVGATDNLTHDGLATNKLTQQGKEDPHGRNVQADDRLVGPNVNNIVFRHDSRHVS